MRKAMIGLAVLAAMACATSLQAKIYSISCIQFNTYVDEDGISHSYTTTCG